MGKRVVIAGASGLVGSNLLYSALKHRGVSQVLALVRRDLPEKDPKLKQLRVSYDDLEEVSEEIQGDVIFVCLGTTKRKTPIKTEYKKVDYNYPLALARIAMKNNISQYHLISAMGASKSSMIFYSRLKGELEAAVSQLNFESLHIYQPSLLTGERAENRLGEELMSGLMKIVNPLLTGRLRKYRSISAEVVARAMLNQSLIDLKGKFVYTSDKIQDLA